MGVLKKLQEKIKGWFKSKDNIMFRGQILTIERAPEPSDILYLNCEKKFDLFRFLGIFLLTFLIIIASFGVISLLSYFQEKIFENKTTTQKKSDDNAVTILNIVIGASLQVVNQLLWLSLSFFLQIEYNHTITQKIISQMNKALVATGLNIIFLPILLNVIFKSNMYG